MHIIFLILLLFVVIVSISIVGFSLHLGISPMPSSDKAKQAILSCIPENVHMICELGSGWGGLALLLAKNFPHAHIHAFELSPFPWFVSQVMKKLKKLSLIIEKKNFFAPSLSEADIIICYLYPKAMHKLKNKFEDELKKGAFVISNSFAVPGWKPTTVIRINDLWRSEIFVYQR